jgi:hypothetical protein
MFVVLFTAANFPSQHWAFRLQHPRLTSFKTAILSLSYNPMPRLQGLADGLLLEVLSTLQQNKATLCHVARVCSRLYRLVQPFIMQDLDLPLYVCHIPNYYNYSDIPLDLFLSRTYDWTSSNIDLSCKNGMSQTIMIGYT